MTTLHREYIKSKAVVTDSEAREYFEKNSKRIQTKFHVWQIYYRGEETRIAQDSKDLKSGMPFEKVAARRFPNLPKGMKAPWDLGDLYWFQIPAPWQGVVDRLEPGQVSDIIKGPNDRFWVIKLVDKTVDPNNHVRYGKGENRRSASEAEGRRTLRHDAGSDEGEIENRFPEIGRIACPASGLSIHNTCRWSSKSICSPANLLFTSNNRNMGLFSVGYCEKGSFRKRSSHRAKIFLLKDFPSGYNSKQYAGRAYSMQLMEVLDTKEFRAARNHPDPHLRRISCGILLPGGRVASFDGMADILR